LVSSFDCSSGNDEEIGDGLASHHAAPQFIMSPAENKMFHAAAFNFPNIDPSALLGAYEQRAQLTAQLITQLTDRPTNAITLLLSPSAHT